MFVSENIVSIVPSRIEFYLFTIPLGCVDMLELRVLSQCPHSAFCISCDSHDTGILVTFANNHICLKCVGRVC